MATYKVPQDVEADDKLIGPFSFRQFVYLLIVVMAIALAWGLAQLFIGLAIIPLPIIVFFGALALPLRKDQPMEIYLAAIVSFYLKPHMRKWDPEGVESLIEITAPKVIEERRTKDLSQDEAERRLSYLANVVDSQGWAIRGVGGASNTAMNNDVYLEAQSAEDVLDTNTNVAHTFDQMMNQRTEQLREEARQRMMQANSPQQPSPAQAPVAPVPVITQPSTNDVSSAPVQNPTLQQATPVTPPSQPVNDPLLSQMAQQITTPEYNPYPTFHQSVIQPLNDKQHEAKTELPETPATEPKKETTSSAPLSAGIMNLANNSDLSIETIAHEAHRLQKKAEEESEEVVISLR